MDFIEKRRRIAEEFETYYGSYDSYKEPLLAQMEELYQTYKEEPILSLKTRIIRLFCDVCPVHVFKESPFFFEMSSGRGRFTWGGLQSEPALFLMRKKKELWLTPYTTDMSEDKEQGFMYHGKDNPVGLDHFCLGYDNLLKEGFLGIIDRATNALSEENDVDKKLFLQSAIDSCKALIGLSKRFSDNSWKLARQANEDYLIAHYTRIAMAAEKVPANAPETFYEALCTIVFCRECISSVEGIGVSTFGHLDRMLWPYYEADIDAGRITREEAKELLHALLTYTHVRFESDTAFHETSTTIVIGGCDREGNTVYNEITRIILECLLEGRYINTKINCRISSKHPREYIEMLAKVQTSEIPVIVMQNDDVLISARVRQGQEEQDARLYVGGGCHEVVLANTEVNTRADTWINPTRVLLDVMEKSPEYATWDEFYTEVIRCVKAYLDHVAETKNKYEQYWGDYSPMPLCSATLTGCIESGTDLTKGGTKYSNTSLSLVGPATFVDSLYSIKHLVWDTKRLSVNALYRILSADFAGNESLRQYIVRKIPKYGTNHPELNVFSAKVLHDVSQLSRQKNARGGEYLPAFYPHNVFLHLGERTGATPDGRKKGQPLSRGCSPSEFIEVNNPLDIISGLEAIDFTEYSDSFCTEMTLPRMNPAIGIPVFIAMVEAFLKHGGSSLQFNLLDRSMLVDAQKHPENYRNLIVRVCGFSALFISLAKDQQDEVITRAIR